MTFLDYNVSEAVEPYAVEPGEYKLRFIDIRHGTDKNGNPYIMPRFEFVDEPDAADVSHFIGLPTNDMDPKRRSRTSWQLKSFAEALGADLTGFDPETFYGTEVFAIVGLQESEQYGEQNTIKKFIVGYLS